MEAKALTEPSEYSFLQILCINMRDGGHIKLQVLLTLAQMHNLWLLKSGFICWSKEYLLHEQTEAEHDLMSVVTILKMIIFE